MKPAMDAVAAREFRRRWQRVAEIERAAPLPSPETRLRQLGALLTIAREAGWALEKPRLELEEVRRRWESLRRKWRAHGQKAR
jgi:hypothetical protein